MNNFTGDCVNASTWFAHDSLEAAREFCLRHGEDPENVPWIEYAVVDMPLLRFGIYIKKDGRCQLDPDDPSLILTTTREHALAGQLPHWWQPTLNGVTA